MRARSSLLLLALLALPLSARQEGAADVAPEEVLLFRLRNGGILWGSIEEHAAEQVSVRRLDNGGLVRLPWELLESSQELDLRQRFGYVDTAAEEILIPGQRLLLMDGQELFGLLLAPIDDDYVLKESGGQRRIRKSLVKQITREMVPALEVFTKSELYLQESAGLDPTDARAHYDLAAWCERIFDFANALKHYQRAAELDPGFKAAELPNILARVAVKAQQQEQLELLGEIDRQGRRRQYQRALELLADFDVQHPDTPLRTNRLRLEDKIKKARTAYVRDEIVRLKWYSWMERLAAEAARIGTYDASIAYVEERMAQEIAERVTADARRYWPDIEVDQVRTLWRERKPGRWRYASYGQGTWLLGEDDAFRGSPESKAKESSATSERDARRDELDRRMERFLRSQQVTRRTRRTEEQTNEIESFWAGMSQANRRGWLLAYFVENSGEVQLGPRPQLQNCSSCAGLGFREILYTGSAKTGSGTGGLRRERCEICRGVKVVRRVQFR